MRIALLALALAACAPTEPAGVRNDTAARLAAELDGRVVVGTPNCIPSSRTMDQVAIGRDILFRSGDTTFVARTEGGCEALQTSGYALVLNTIGTRDLCRGTIARVVNTGSGSFAGSCAIDQIIEYRRP